MKWNLNINQLWEVVQFFFIVNVLQNKWKLIQETIMTQIETFCAEIDKVIETVDETLAKAKEKQPEN